MTPRELEILNLIKDNPYISQREIADKLDITRSSVAVHINNLYNKGYVLGRQYVIREEPYVTVIGGASLDILGVPNEKLMEKDSNPGKIFQSAGGVGRNICENLARLGVMTSFISVVGKDQRGEFLLDEMKKIGIDGSNVYEIEDMDTSVYIAILDEKRDMHIALNDMDIMNALTPNLISNKKQFIENAELSVFDTNISEDTISYLLNSVEQKFFVDCVSVAKTKKLKNHLDKIYFLKANKYEAEFLSEMEINSIGSAEKAAKKLVDDGLKSICVTLGEDGVIYADKNETRYSKAKDTKVVSTSGAGDAFIAGYVYAFLKEYNVKERLEFAQAASRVVLASDKTMSEQFTVYNIEEEMKNA